MISGYAISSLVNLLMTSKTERSQICSARPHGVSENATFVIVVDEVRFSDLRSDDLGLWKATGTNSTYFSVTNSGIRISERTPQPQELFKYYLLT